MTPRTDAALEALRALDALASAELRYTRVEANLNLAALSKGHLLRAMEALKIQPCSCLPAVRGGGPMRHSYAPRTCNRCSVLDALADAILGPEEATTYA